MATDPNRFISLGTPPILANEIAKAIDEAIANTELTVTLTGTANGTDTAKISDGIAITTTA